MATAGKDRDRVSAFIQGFLPYQETLSHIPCPSCGMLTLNTLSVRGGGVKIVCEGFSDEGDEGCAFTVVERPTQIGLSIAT